jgi:hypothetical protein
MGIVEESTVEIMRGRELLKGDQWAVYQSMALDSATAGHVICMLVGPSRTHKTPPPHLHDGDHGPGYRYHFRGMLDLENNQLQPIFIGVSTGRISSAHPNESCSPQEEK